MQLKTVQWVVVLALVCAGLGCSTTGSTSNDKPATNRWGSSASADNAKPIGLLIEPKPAAEMGYRIGWASPIELNRGQEITHVTVLGDIVLVIEDPDNIVTAINADNGELLWKRQLGSRLEKLFKPSRDGDYLFLHTNNRLFTLHKRDGEVLSVANMETSVGSSGVYDPTTKLMILSGSNGKVFAHSVTSNFTRWRYNLNSRITNPPALAQQDVFIVDTGGTYVMLESATGMPLWRNRTLGAVRAAPTVQGSEIIVASEDGKLYAFNRTTGKDTWKYLGAEQPLVAAPIALGRLIVQPLLPAGGMVAVNAINGEEVWRNDINAKPVVTRQQDMVLFKKDGLVSIDLDDGEAEVQAPTLNLMDAMPIDDDNSILLVSPSGRLLRLNPI